jgi:hypothetical protein
MISINFLVHHLSKAEQILLSRPYVSSLLALIMLVQIDKREEGQYCQCSLGTSQENHFP